VNEIIEYIKNYIHVDVDNDLVYEYMDVADYTLLYTYTSYDIDIIINQDTHIFISRSTHTLLMLYIIIKHYYNNHHKNILDTYIMHFSHPYINTVATHILIYAYNLYIMNIQPDMAYVLLMQICLFIIEMFMIILSVLGI
jgi:hypothetical protein